MKRRGDASISREAAPAPAPAPAPVRVERKIVEKNRRIKMKQLCFNLVSLIPPRHLHTKKEMMSQVDQLEQATNYIVQLRERVQQLKEKKAKLSTEISTQDLTRSNSASFVHDSRYPIMELRDLGSCLEVILISQLHKNFMLFEVIGVLQDEGAEVVGVNVVTASNKVYHTLHAQVKSPRIGVETSRIGGRLHDLVSVVTPFMHVSLN